MHFWALLFQTGPFGCGKLRIAATDAGFGLKNALVARQNVQKLVAAHRPKAVSGARRLALLAYEVSPLRIRLQGAETVQVNCKTRPKLWRCGELGRWTSGRKARLDRKHPLVENADHSDLSLIDAVEDHVAFDLKAAQSGTNRVATPADQWRPGQESEIFFQLPQIDFRPARSPFFFAIRRDSVDVRLGPRGKNN